MPDILHAIQSGQTSLWLFIPTAILLGALHGLEPGHSKTMMAAFIIAIRGTLLQAVLLGVSAALSHTLIIALLAIAALEFGSRLNADTAEPYIQLVSAACVFAMACWMFWRTRRDLDAAHHHHHHHHDHDHHHHEHHHHEHPHEHPESFLLEVGGGKLELSVYEDGVPPVFRLRAPAGEILPPAASVSVETIRQDGTRQTFAFAGHGEFLQSQTEIPEPHEFSLALTVDREAERSTAHAEFREHDHVHDATHSHDFQDAHELEHAEDIRRRFAGRTVTTPQIVLFGITGGLTPCPAAFSVLIICLQLKRVAMGATLVASFSFGLALTMVATGALAAWSVRQAERKFSGFGELMRRAPFVSCALLVLVAAYMAWHGWSSLPPH
jgi:nickel/cobalt exporter